MKRDVAERLAAPETNEIRPPQVRDLIETFLEKLAVCSMCEGAKDFAYSRTTILDDPNGMKITVPAGAGGPCPKCQGTGHDPEFAAWHCMTQLTEHQCRTAQGHGNGTAADHASCGYRVMLPLPQSFAKPSA